MVVVGGREEIWVVKAFSDVISSTVDMVRTVFDLGCGLLNGTVQGVIMVWLNEWILDCFF